MASFIGSLKRLFSFGGKKKKEPTPAEMTDALIGEALSMNLADATGEGGMTTLRRARFGEFQHALEEQTGGYILSVFAADEQARAAFVFPEATVRRYADTLAKSRGGSGPGDAAAMDRCMDLLDGRVSKLFFIGGEGDSGAGPFFRMKKTFGPGEREGILWFAAGCSIIEVAGGDKAFYILMTDETDRRLKESIGNPQFLKTARSIVLRDAGTPMEEGREDREDFTIAIVRPKEFVLGSVFLPVFVKDGEVRISSRFTGIAVSRNAPPWRGPGVLLHLVIDAAAYDIWYCFQDATMAGLVRAGGSFDAVFKAILKECMIFLKTHCRKLQITSIRYQAGSPPPEGDFGRFAVLSASMKINFIPFNAAVVVPREFLNLLFPFFARPEDLYFVKESMKNLLVSVVSLNRSMFARGLRTFMKKFRGGGEAMPAALSGLPFYEFMELVDDRDLRIIVQNFIAPALSDGYMRLFRVSEVVKNGETGRRELKVRSVDADYDRLRQFLPRKIADAEYDAEASTPQEDFDRVNREFMNRLYKAVMTDKLVLSYRAGFILKNQFFDIVQEEYEKLLGGLRAKGVPVSGMKGIGAGPLARVAGRLANRDLALAVMDDPEGRGLVASVMGDNRRAEFLSDLDFTARRFREGSVTPEDVYRGILLVQEEVEKEMKRRKPGA